MAYQIGDQVIHRGHGLGTITAIEEKTMANKLSTYYVVQTSQVTLWIPLNSTENSIRPPLTRPEFQTHLDLLCSPCEVLPDHHRERQIILAERMKFTTLAEACRIVRDLTARSKSQPLNKNDRDVMEAAVVLVLNEWEVVEGISREEAGKRMARLLD